MVPLGRRTVSQRAVSHGRRITYRLSIVSHFSIFMTYGVSGSALQSYEFSVELRWRIVVICKENTTGRRDWMSAASCGRGGGQRQPMNIFTTSGSWWSKNRLLPVSRRRISSISSSESEKSRMSRFWRMRSIWVDFGMMITSR